MPSLFLCEVHRVYEGRRMNHGMDGDYSNQLDVNRITTYTQPIIIQMEGSDACMK